MSASRMLVAGLAKGVSVTARLSSIDSSLHHAGGVQNSGSVLDRIQRLIKAIQDKALDSSTAASGGSAGAAAAFGQRAIDRALIEIGQLVGMPLKPGGVERALVSGLNEEQIEAYEILSLRPNAELTLSGSLHRPPRHSTRAVAALSGGLGSLSVSTDVSGLNQLQIAALNTGSLQAGSVTAVSGSLDVARAAAELLYEGGLGAVVNGTASFRLTGPQGSANFSITSGEALADVAQRINDQSAATGIVAAVQGDWLALSTTATGAAATVVIDNVVRENMISVSGVNGSQVDGFQVVSMPDETEITIGGDVTQAATRATLTYLGSPGGVVVDSATFTLTGDLGSAPISIVQNESLALVADRINQLSGTTGASASISGDDLILSSVDIGSAADLAIELSEIAQYLDVAGVNASQITNFQVLSAEPDSVNTLSGSVTQAAAAAQLSYTGTVSGRIVVGATFTLSGSLGSAEITVTALEKLTAVRDRINQQTATTGVAASISGDNLLLTSTGVGSAATVAVVVSSGTFAVTGGNGDGTANGIDAQLNINGQPVVTAGNDVTYSDALGSYSFTLVNGFTGAFDAITITSANGTFDVVGGNGDGTATGSDAVATINGQALTASGNSFTINTGGGQFVLQLADGFTGPLDPIVVTSSFAPFTISGGNGDATANGTDAQATINGQTLTSANGNFTVATPAGNLVVGFVDSFVGPFDPFTITVGHSSVVAPSSNSKPSSGRLATATINGQTVNQQNGRFLVNQNGVQIALQFAPRFNGKFDPFSVTVASDQTAIVDSPLDDADAEQLRSILEPLLSLASGGENAGLNDNSGRAVRLAAAVLLELDVFRIGRLAAVTPRSLNDGASLIDVLA